ncbi:LUD domain-containing protein [Patescibacteria group bacterium]|nr:LUD domain-containing protein [Patescibacteria group bacterium]
MGFDQLASEEQINRAVEALTANGFSVEVLPSGEAAKQRVLELLPEQAEVMNMTSVTLETIGVAKEILESGRYDAVRNRFKTLDAKTQASEKRKLGAGPDWALGSVHAVTEDGKVIIASATGSQLPAYLYGAGRVIWVVGTQKIVKDLEEGKKRVYEYVLPLESERARQAYGGAGSSVNKLAIIHKEGSAGRITLLLVKERLGF